MNFSILLNGTQLTIHFRERGNYRFFNEVCSEIIRRENTVVINEIVIEVDGINYLIPNGIEKIRNGITEDEILLDKTLFDPHQSEKEKDILKEKARIAFESSDAVKKIKEKEAAALIKKQEQEKERIDNEEPVWFYSKDVKTREGPISFNELKNLHKNKTIEDDALVWSPNLEEWEEAYNVVNKKNTSKPTQSSPIKEHELNSPEIISHQSSSSVNSINSTSNDQIVNDTAKSGIGGWLILVAIGIVITPIRIIIILLTAYDEVFKSGAWEILTTQGTQAYNSLWAPLIMGEMIGNALILAVWLYMGYLFFSKIGSFPKIYIRLAIISFIFILVNALSLQLVLPNEPLFNADTAKELMRGLIMVVIWVPYMMFSKRVKATFIN